MISGLGFALVFLLLLFYVFSREAMKNIFLTVNQPASKPAS
jgi:Na+-transporting methylmalonyl-CoA/oxaloacetate decarboxylase gamma subunit